MAIRPIVLAPDPRLLQISEPVDKVDDNIRQLMDDMVETMCNEKSCIGLAAVQVGVLKRVLVLDLAVGDRENKEILCMANPEIIESSDDKVVLDEACMSFPGQALEIMRSKKIKVKYIDYDNKPQELEVDDYTARLVQHEMDHLNGIVIASYAMPMKRSMIMSKAEKIKNKLQKMKKAEG